MSIRDLHEQLQRGETTSVALTEQYLTRIAAHNPALNAYLAVTADHALTQARAADARRAAGGDVSPLTGIPLAIKDNMVWPHAPTTCASKILEHYRAPYTATAVAKLEAHGAVILGKTNLDEFAMGAANEFSAFGPVHNPWNLEHSPGGSSGGSAAAVAADLCAGSLGSDTGGSIRQPASLCGIVGLKPTYGRVSRYGLVAFASSLDQIGPFGTCVDDVALMLDAIAGHDPHDSTASAEHPVPAQLRALTPAVRGLRVGVVREYIDMATLDVRNAMIEALRVLADQGATLVDITLPNAKYSVPCYYIVAPAEASANLARFDGVRFGHRTRHAGNLRDLYARSRGEGFGPEVIRRIMIGTYVLSSGYYDAYYRKALDARALIHQDFATAFAQVDLVCTPTTPYAAFKLGETSDDPVQRYLADVCTCLCNLGGLPGVSIPCGFDSNQLPIGLQLIGRPFDEVTMLGAAAAYEQATDWHTKKSPLAVQ